MAQADIDQAIAEFVQGAKNAIAAGFDGVEIHAANGLPHRPVSQKQQQPTHRCLRRKPRKPHPILDGNHHSRCPSHWKRKNRRSLVPFHQF